MVYLQLLIIQENPRRNLKCSAHLLKRGVQGELLWGFKPATVMAATCSACLVCIYIHKLIPPQFIWNLLGLKACSSISTGGAKHVTALISTFTCLTFTSLHFHSPPAPLSRQIRWSVKPAGRHLFRNIWKGKVSQSNDRCSVAGALSGLLSFWRGGPRPLSHPRYIWANAGDEDVHVMKHHRSPSLYRKRNTHGGIVLDL